MEIFRWGIIAPGRIASKFAEAVQKQKNMTVAAAASRDKTNARQFSSIHKIEKAYGSYSELIEDPDIDAVYIAAPHPFHKDLTLQALEGGKPVLCEKPLAVNSTDAGSMIRKAREEKLFLMEGMWTRYLPVMKKIKESVENGIIGEVKMIRADFTFQADPDPKGRQLNPELAGGALLDVGIYPLSLAWWILGKPESILSRAEIGRTGVDIQAGILMQYKSGAVAQLSCGVSARGPVTAEITGTEGIIEIPGMFHMTEKARIITRKETEDIFIPHDVNGFEYEAAAAAESIRNGLKEDPVMPLDETLEIMKTMDDLRKEWGVRYPFEK